MAKSMIAAVIVTYKTRRLLEECLNSIYEEASRENLSLRAVVVDNASGDGTAEMVREKFPAALLIVNPDNLGPARAFNRGIDKALKFADKILVANSDIKVLPGTIKAMETYLNENPRVDGVSGPLLNEDGSRQMIKTHIWSLRRPNWEQRFRLEFVGTTFAMIRAATFRRTGGYDENYYFYNEDLDWAERAKRENRLFMYLPEAPVIHYQSKGKDQNLSRITRELYWSNIYYYKKFYRSWTWLMYGLLRLDLAYRRFTLGFKLRRETGRKEKEQLEKALTDLKEAGRRMSEEFKREREPRVPFWPEERRPS